MTERSQEADHPKAPPEDLELRAKPRPITRVNRKVLIGGTAIVCLALFGAVLFALDPPDWRSARKPEELYNTDRKPTAEGLSKLPQSYEDVPQLGPPLPGDLGDAMHKAEVGKGAELPINQQPFRPDPEADLERADRIRLSRLAQQGRESKLFFQVRTVSTEQERAEKPDERSATRQSAFDALSAEQAGGGGGAGATAQATDPNSDPNRQLHKLSFLGGKADTSIYNPHRLESPVSPYQLMAGTIIPASLVTGLNSDLPGLTIAQVTENVYDTVTGRFLLIPQGTRLIGKYDSVVAFGQKRALVVWQRLILPNGTSVLVDNLPATDEAGYAGLEDEVDFHTWQLLKGIGLATLIGVGTELSFGDQENDLVAAIRESAQQNTSRSGDTLVQKTLDIQPTITVRPGWPVRIIVSKDIVLEPYGGAR
ncbi:MAG: TrbI/VirB10 family protein [Parvibaculaceae bacterium]